ncbi:diguanylate cyclase [Tardiphaga sp. 841_E9_N1_2]|uniref:diguanylate cyclase n=1 Tax=Tardiphaga sp. 841_E9_N1_2 TaxID=3240762 RepID=UPI003F1F4826
MALRDLLAPQARRTTFVAAAILGAGLAATFAIREFSERLIAADMQRRFAVDAVDISNAISERLRTHAEVLVSMQGLYASIGRVDRAQFRRYIDVLDLGRRYPGFQALQSLRHVTPDHLDAFVAEVRADKSIEHSGQPDFAVRPPGPRSIYNVVEFVEPMRGNENALGFDAGANPAQLDSLRRSAETGRIVATPPVKLVQDTSGGLGFIIRAPIYRAGEPTQTVSQRNAALHGFVASVYRTNDLMRGILDPRTLQQMHIQVVDRGYAKPTQEGVMIGEPEDTTVTPTLMYDSLEPNLGLVTQMVMSAGISADRSLVVGERVWRVLFTANPGSIYEVSHTVPNVVLASGSAISLLMMLLAVITMRSRRLSGNLSTLDAEQRALVDNPLAGILFTAGHRILRGNRRIAELCGRSSATLPGNTIDELVATKADGEAFDAALNRIRDSAMATEVELHLRRSDGSTLLVDAYGKPLAAGDILWVIQDKTDALAVEAERRAHAQAMEEANERLTTSLQLSEIRAKEIVLLTELSGVLQSCQSREEIFAAVQTYAGYLFTEEAGALYYLNNARNAVQRGAHWGALQADAVSFPVDDCWALRRGTTFPISEASQGLVCNHAGPCGATGTGFICQPLIAQNNLLGLLYREHTSVFGEGADQLATMLAEQVSLAMANLELRELLRQQAVRDPLTDLHNRRYLEDALVRETTRSQQDGKPLALAMLDIDHFKGINDSHGHEAGDAVLRGLGRILRETTRASDIIGRFGGEEFLMLMPGVTVEVAAQRAQQVLDAVHRMQVTLPSAMRDGVTLSIGLAVVPVHVAKGDDLLAAADAALYEAKREGRNRVVISHRRAKADTAA